MTVNGLMCEVTYNITAGGTLNGVLVGPRSFRGNITTGYCPQVITTTSIATTATMNGKEEILHTYVRTYVWYRPDATSHS